MNLLFEDIIVIDKQYLAYLQSFDSRVSQNHPNSKDRPNVAVMLDDNGRKWAIPLSSEHAKRGKNKMPILSLYDKSDYLGHMKFNNMIPLAEGTYETAFGRYDFNYDSLLSKQKSFIVNNFDKEVVPRFYSAFSTQALSKDEPDNKFYAIYNNFPLLATKAAVWQLIVNVEKEINKRLSLDPPKEEEAYNALKRILNNESCQDVLKFKKDTNQYFKGLYDKFRMQEAARKSAEEILRLEKEGQLFDGWDTSDKGKSKDSERIK